jgi:hypothetical protein
MLSESIEARLERLETELLHALTRHDPEHISNLLTEDFCEFGSSGRIYSKTDILEFLRTESPRRFSVTDLRVTVLADGIALVRYQVRQEEPGRESSESLRSSLWVLRDSRWQLLFHQGTKFPASPILPPL